MDEQAVVDGNVESVLGKPELRDDDQAAVEHSRQQELLDEIRKAVNEDPRNVALLNELGVTAEAAGDLNRARWAFKRAIRLEPRSAPAYLRLGLLYQKEDRTKPAVEALQNFLRYSADAGLRGEATESLKQLLDQDGKQLDQLCDEAPGCATLAEAWEKLGLTPAEALFLIDPEKSSGRQMMRYTMLDLAIRGVLDVTATQGVGRGDHFGEAQLQPHEALFAKYFSRFDDYVDVDRLSRAALSELNSRYSTFKDQYVLQSLVDKGYLTKETERVWGVLPVSRYAVSDKGIRARNQAKRLLKQTDGQIVKMLKSDPELAEAYLSDGGPAILLIDELPASSFQEWQDALEQMGFGPTVERLRSRAQAASQGDVVDNILKMLFGR